MVAVPELCCGGHPTPWITASKSTSMEPVPKVVVVSSTSNACTAAPGD
jgi:hypothetical protein